MQTQNFLELLVDLYAKQNHVKVKYSVDRKVSNRNQIPASGFKKKPSA